MNYKTTLFWSIVSIVWITLTFFWDIDMATVIFPLVWLILTSIRLDRLRLSTKEGKKK